MITPRLRPRMQLVVPMAPEAIAGNVDARLHEPESPCRGLATPRQIDLWIRERDRHFWSPQLTLHVHAEGEHSRLVGHFGPNANVWTLFLAAYGFVVLTALTGLLFGVSQLFVGESPWGLWAVPAGLVLVVVIYVAAGIGQRLGHGQVDVLEAFIERATAAPGTPP